MAMLLLAIGLLAGCGYPRAATDGETGRPVKRDSATLSIMHFMAEKGAHIWLNDVVERFRGRHPDVAVEIQYVNSDNYATVLRNRIASDNSPDMYLLAYLDGPDSAYIEQGFLEDLSGQPFLERIPNIERFRVDGGIYGMPFDMNVYGVFYNRDVFRRAGIDSPPRTYDEFTAALDKLESAGFIPIAAGYQEINILNSDLLADLLVSQIAERPTWREDAARRHIRFAEDATIRNALIRLAERYAYTQPGAFETDRNKSAALVASGEAAMLINGSWYIDSILTQNPETELGFFPFPHSGSPEENAMPLGASFGGWAVNRYSPNKAYVFELLEIMTTEEMALSLQTNKKAISIVQGVSVPDSSVFGDIRRYIDEGLVVDYTGASVKFPDPQHQLFHQIVSAYLMDPEHDVDRALAELDEAFDRQIRTTR
jgi:raffinose/stachyose/melibiose transport system substrate-binding protein